MYFQGQHTTCIIKRSICVILECVERNKIKLFRDISTCFCSGLQHVKGTEQASKYN